MNGPPGGTGCLKQVPNQRFQEDRQRDLENGYGIGHETASRSGADRAWRITDEEKDRLRGKQRKCFCRYWFAKCGGAPYQGAARLQNRHITESAQAEAGRRGEIARCGATRYFENAAWRFPSILRGTANAFSRRSRAGRRYRSETPSRQTVGSAASRGRCTEGGLVSKPINRGPGAAASGPIADVGRVERFVRP